jgi:hypothetical protein
MQELEEALDLPLANFAWTRDQYAKVEPPPEFRGWTEMERV